MSVMTGPRGIPSTTRNALPTVNWWPSRGAQLGDDELNAPQNGARGTGGQEGRRRALRVYPSASWSRRRRKMFARTTVVAASLFCCLGARPAGGQIRDAARFYHLTRTIKV